MSEDQIRFVRTDDASLHPGQSANIMLDEKFVGRLGKLHPRILSALGMDASIYLFELQLNELLCRADANIFQPISKYPANRRDITVIIENSVTVAEIRSNIEQMHINSLQNIKVLSIYKGKGIPETKKSVSLGLILQEFSRTLTDKELEQTVLSIISQLKNKVGAEIRS